MGHEIEAQHPTAATLDREQSGAQPQDARLPGAVRAAQEDDLATLHLEGGAGEHGKAAQHGHRVTQIDRKVRCGDARVGVVGGRGGVHDRRETLRRRSLAARTARAPRPAGPSRTKWTDILGPVTDLPHARDLAHDLVPDTARRRAVGTLRRIPCIASAAPSTADSDATRAAR